MTLTPDQITLLLQILSILLGSGLVSAIFNWYTRRGKEGADLTLLYKKLAAFDPSEMLELRERVQKLERPRDFVFSFRAHVNGEGVVVTDVEAREIKIRPLGHVAKQ